MRARKSIAVRRRQDDQLRAQAGAIADPFGGEGQPLAPAQKRQRSVIGARGRPPQRRERPVIEIAHAERIGRALGALAQRDAFKAANTKEAKEALSTGCEASLKAMKDNPACK